MMQLGVDGVFVGSGVFKSSDPARRAAAIVKSVTHYRDASILAEASRNLGEPMVGMNVAVPSRKRSAWPGVAGRWIKTSRAGKYPAGFDANLRDVYRIIHTKTT
jgi:hypothetical protein